MAEKLDSNQLVAFKELLMSEVIQSESLINLLDRKGIVSKQELLELDSCDERLDEIYRFCAERGLLET